MRKEKNENRFQPKVIEEIQERMPKAVIEKSDSSYRQGTPDLTIYNGKQWAKLECKKNEDAKYRPNQKTLIEMFDEMSFCRHIEPENKEEVLNELFQFFGV